MVLLNFRVQSRLQFADLAGCEDPSSEGPRHQEHKEQVDINSGLGFLGQVVEALADRQKFVPFRSSSLTHLLKVTSFSYICSCCVDLIPSIIVPSMRSWCNLK